MSLLCELYFAIAFSQAVNFNEYISIFHVYFRVIYSLLKNEHIDSGFKSRLQRAAFFGRDNAGKCNFYNCPKTDERKNKNS
jgi:hypothetical protein